jgi:hypothetical protein
MDMLISVCTELGAMTLRLLPQRWRQEVAHDSFLGYALAPSVGGIVIVVSGLLLYALIA